MGKKKWMLLFLLMIIAALPLNAQASSKKSKALKAYREFLSQDEIPWGDDMGSITVASSDCTFSIAYIDNDSVPELIIESGKVPHSVGFGLLYTYRGDKMTFVCHFDFDTDAYYYKKTGVFVSSYGNGGILNNYYQLSKGKAKLKITYAKLLEGTDFVTYYYKKSGSSYNAITKTKFNSTLKKLVGTKKKTKLVMRKNTAGNRKKYLK